MALNVISNFAANVAHVGMCSLVGEGGGAGTGGGASGGASGIGGGEGGGGEGSAPQTKCTLVDLINNGWKCP